MLLLLMVHTNFKDHFLFLTNGEPTGETKNFIDWVLSDDGGKVLADEKIIKTSK